MRPETRYCLTRDSFEAVSKARDRYLSGGLPRPQAPPVSQPPAELFPHENLIVRTHIEAKGMSLTTDQKAGSPPPYGEDSQHASNAEAPPCEPPPAYEAADSEATQPAADVKVRPPEHAATHSADDQLQSSSEAGPSSSAPRASSSATSSSSMNPLSLVQSYKDKRRAKQAAKKVDFYEKLYGFVPKNAMTEAEWKDARARAPKVKKPVTPGARPYFGC